jgi:ascorbate-specific PTS system EIIC-type component UlaA
LLLRWLNLLCGKITEANEIAIGHGQTLLNMRVPGVGKLVGKPEDSTEKCQDQRTFNFLRDMAVSISLVMLAVSFIGAFLAVGRSVSPALKNKSAAGRIGCIYPVDRP